jgi:hypothetical protein
MSNPIAIGFENEQIVSSPKNLIVQNKIPDSIS